MLSLSDFQVETDGKVIVDHLSLEIHSRELSVLMGPNGSGKSSLSLALAGHSAYHVGQASRAQLNGVDLLNLKPEVRAQAGLFLSFQHPVAIPGLSVQQLIRASWEHVHPDKAVSVAAIRDRLHTYCQLLGIEPAFLSRSVNDGFSGGEKKRLEMLQLLMLEPKMAILDEIDSGLDVDAIQLIAAAITYAQQKFGTAFIIVTHYRRILDHIKPDRVHVMVKGSIVQSGGAELIDVIDKHGYKNY